MRDRVSRRRRFLASVVSVGLASTGLLAAGLPAAAGPPDLVRGTRPPDATAKSQRAGDKLGAHDRELLAEARAGGEKTVTLIIATAAGKAKEVDAQVKRLGGLVGYREDRIGYVRATVPTASVAKTVALGDVRAVDLNESLPLPDPRAEFAAGPTGPSLAATGPGPGTPDGNPFMPTRETGAVAFKRSHPAWDGRGVTIGILDSGVDLDHPALATTSTGERKIIDWVTAVDPLLEDDATWRPMITTVTGPNFTVAEESWTAPAGTFRFNLFSEAITAGGEPEGDVNRDGDTTDRFGVLYRESDHAIWVDSDQDHDFTDDPLMRPYKEQYQVGHFGADDPATDVREQMPFVVEFREDVDLTPAGRPGQKADFVNIGIVESAHGSHVAGIAAGNDLFGGGMDGAAPGARIVSSRACTWDGGCTAVALTEGMVDLVARRGVDVVNMSIGGLPVLNDGNNARAQLYNRLIDEFGVQLFISAGNSGPGLNTVGDPSVATDVVSVGASVSKATWSANYGSVVSARRNMFNFSSRGPREDGGFKPNVTAPGSAISTIPLWQSGSPVPEAGYDLPPGYAMFNGTSMAAPQAAGAAALLLSASFATRVPVTPAQLRQSLYSAADFNAGVPAYVQGLGQIDVPATWRLLRDEPRVQGYTVSAPVCTEISSFLTVPHTGPGIYNRCSAARGGHAPGQAKTYDLTVVRASGPPGNRTHRLRWIGNDGTFGSTASVGLPLGQPRTVTVRARPVAGAHGALLVLDDPGTRGVDHTVMNTVVASTGLAGPSFGWRTTGTVERNRTRSFFLTVPEGVAALQVNLSGIATRSQTRFIAVNPYGVPVESSSSLVCYTNFSDPAVCDPTSRAYLDPIPGVWEIEVESRRTSPFLTNPFTVQVAAQGVAVEPAQVVLETVTAGQPAPVSWTIANDFGPVTVTPRGGPLGSAFTDRPSISDQETREFAVDVPAGASRLDVAIGNTSDLGADLDLTVFKDGVPVARDADGDSEESVSIADPEPGTYTAQVFAFAVPAGTTDYDYRDVYFGGTLGSVAVSGAPVTLASGASTTVRGTVTASRPPAQGRQLFGEMLVVTSEGAVVGRGGVLIKAVEAPS